MGIWASGRVLDKSHASIMRWEQKLAAQHQQWNPPAPSGSDITIEGDEVYTRVGENHSTDAHGNPPPCESKGGTVTFIEGKSRYLVAAEAGLKNTDLFAKATALAWKWSKPSSLPN